MNAQTFIAKWGPNILDALMGAGAPSECIDDFHNLRIKKEEVDLDQILEDISSTDTPIVD